MFYFSDCRVWRRGGESYCLKSSYLSLQSNLCNCIPPPPLSFHGLQKLVCKLSVIVFFQHDKAYISEEGCQEAQAPPDPPNDPEMANDPAYQYEKEDGPVYV